MLAPGSAARLARETLSLGLNDSCRCGNGSLTEEYKGIRTLRHWKPGPGIWLVEKNEFLPVLRNVAIVVRYDTLTSICTGGRDRHSGKECYSQSQGSILGWIRSSK